MASTVADVQQTFSSWDACMSKVYCKWPVIAAIIIASLIVLSVLFCVVRCICFGAECCACCCGCMRCCSPNRRSKANRGWENSPPAPYPYPQYNSPAPPAYMQSSPYRGPATATFDAPSSGHHNADALPSMPTWSNATTRRVEDEHVEMDRLENGHDQEQHLLAAHETQQQQYPEQAHGQPQYDAYPSQHEQNYSAYSPQDHGYAGQQQYGYSNNGSTNQAPFHDYGNHQQYAPSMSPGSSMYAPSTAVPPSYRTSAPSYHTNAPSMTSPPPPVQYQMDSHAVGRKPVQGSWRDV